MSEFQPPMPPMPKAAPRSPLFLWGGGFAVAALAVLAVVLLRNGRPTPHRGRHRRE
ncbi:hypothetical protein [Streptomonospora litoralis]|uniref:Uncharacterized protein n=1 Tax=Streptomonospora litoralis TaxID=2498135 RepID=A0A4P6PZJ8_9ACTN|nr:hypothetical protein [Streptomonospora litoralis]QBI53573.1 hypothetical protein EKD16_08895 [Streptomonospora litoralis]